MPTPIQVLLASADPNAPIPTTMAGLIAVLRPLLSGNIPDGNNTVGNVVVQANIPSTVQQGLVWKRLTGNGAFLGDYTYFSGRWCKNWPHNPGMCDFLRTDPTKLFNMTTGLGLFDSGTPGLAGDFYGWKLRLATDPASKQILNRAIIIAQEWDGTQFLCLLPDKTTKAHQGDKTGSYIDDSNVPLLPAVGRELDFAAAQSGSTPTGTPRLVVSQFTKGDDVKTDPTASGVGSTSPAKFSGMPPFLSWGVMEYIGQTYTDAAAALNI